MFLLKWKTKIKKIGAKKLIREQLLIIATAAVEELIKKER